MHVLHRPHLPHAATIAAACAALAIVLTLLLAGTLNDLTSTSAGGSPTRGTDPRPVDADRCGMESEPVHEPVALPRPGPVDGGLLATSCDADRDRW